MYTETTKEENTMNNSSERQWNNGATFIMGHGYAQEWNPSQILHQCPEKTSMSSTVLQKSITKISNSRKNNRARQKNLETMKIESIHLDSESEEEIVDDRSDRRGSNPIYIHRTISVHIALKGN